MSTTHPNQNEEKKLHERGIRFIAGVDEAGRGALAGPLVAAAVMMPLTPSISGIQDSKKITPKKRTELYKKIISLATSWSVSIQSAHTIDTEGVQCANVFAMHDAVRTLKQKPEYVFSDHLRVDVGVENMAIPHGDARIYSIAAASIIAKVTRDTIMCILAKHYPQYDFEKHKGYGTTEHFTKIREHGISKIHRHLFLRKFFTAEKTMLAEKNPAMIY